MPTMIVIAGPPGGGKSTVFGRSYFTQQGIPYFNIDDRCAEIHGTRVRIPDPVRRQANDDLRSYCAGQIAQRQTFSFETTLRQPFAIRQARVARQAGYFTKMYFVALESAERHVARVIARSAAGGHGASEARIRQMYEDSMANLPQALVVYDQVLMYDNAKRLSLKLEVRDGRALRRPPEFPSWIRAALGRALELGLQED